MFLLFKPLNRVNLNSCNPLLIQNNNVVNITKTQGLCGRAHGGEVCECTSRNWGSSRKEIGREGLWQGEIYQDVSYILKSALWSWNWHFSFTFMFLPTGICCPRTVSGTEERWGVVSGMVERYMWSQHQTARRLLWLSARVVWLFPVVDSKVVVSSSPPHVYWIHLPHTIN